MFEIAILYGTFMKVARGRNRGIYEKSQNIVPDMFSQISKKHITKQMTRNLLNYLVLYHEMDAQKFIRS